MGYPGWPQACPHSGIPVVHQCRVETSVHHSSSDPRCKDCQGSFQIMCGAMHEKNPEPCQLPEILPSQNMRTWADTVAKRYRPWPKGLRADSLPWFDSPRSRARVDCGIQIKLKCSDRARLAERRSQQKKEPKHAHMNNWDSMRKELKHYRPWLRKGIPDLAYEISAHYSRFGLRDIGTLFPI